MASTVMHGEKVEGKKPAIHELLSQYDEPLRLLASENPNIFSNLQNALNHALAANLDVDGKPTLAENKNGVENHLSDTQVTIARAIRAFAPALTPDSAPDLSTFIKQLTEVAQQQPEAAPVIGTLDPKQAIQTLTDDLRGLGVDDAREVQRNLNLIMGSELELDGLLTRKDGEISNSQRVAAQFIKTYRPDLAQEDLTLADLKSAVSMEYQKLTQSPKAPEVHLAAPSITAPNADSLVLETPAVLSSSPAPVTPKILQSPTAEKDAHITAKEMLAPPPLVAAFTPPSSLPALPENDVPHLAPQFTATANTTDIGTLKPPALVSDTSDIPRQEAAPLPNISSENQKPAEEITWTNPEIALVHEVAQYVEEHFRKHTTGVESAIDNRDYASALHLSLGAMNAYYEDGSYNHLFNRVYDNGATLEQAGNEFGKGPELIFRIEEMLISKGLPNNGGGEVTVRGADGQELSEVYSPTARAFKMALMEPEERPLHAASYIDQSRSMEPVAA